MAAKGGQRYLPPKRWPDQRNEGHAQAGRARPRGDGRGRFGHAPTVRGTEGFGQQPYQWLPIDPKQQEIFRSRDARYGRVTHYSGETTANMPTFPGSGLSPARIASIHTEVITTGRILAKSDLDDQVMSRDTHLRGTDYGRRAAVVGKSVFCKPAYYSSGRSGELARKLAFLGQALLDDIDSFDDACFGLLAANAKGFAAREAVFEHKSLRVAGSGEIVPGDWPQQLEHVENRVFRFDPVKDIPRLQQAGTRYVDIDDPPYKIIFHVGVGDGKIRTRGHLWATVWPHMIKHDGIARFAQCLDFFGIPHVLAELDDERFQNEEIKTETRLAMQQFGDGEPIIKNMAAKWTVTQTPTGLDARGMHATLVGMCNNEQSKAVQHETLTTELGAVGSFAASETHQDTKADIVALDERKLANRIRRWLRELFKLNMPILQQVFGATADEILAAVPKVYWLIHRAVNPEVRQRMRLAAVAAGVPVAIEQEVNENGWQLAEGTEAIPGKPQIVQDGAIAVGEGTAARGVHNEKDAEPSASGSGVERDAPTQQYAATAAGARDPGRGQMNRKGAALALKALAALSHKDK